MSEQVSSGVTAFVALLAFAVLVSIAAERVRIPAAVQGAALEPVVTCLYGKADPT